MGVDGWEYIPNYIPELNAIRGTIRVNTENGWVEKSDYSSKEFVSTRDQDRVKVESSAKTMSSNAFKRAADLWGVGADLRQLPNIFIRTVTVQNKDGKEKIHIFNQRGEIIYDPEKLNEYIWALLDGNEIDPHNRKGTITLGQNEVVRAFNPEKDPSKPVNPSPVVPPAANKVIVPQKTAEEAENATTPTTSPLTPEIVSNILASITAAGNDTGKLQKIKERMITQGYYVGYPKQKIDAALT